MSTKTVIENGVKWIYRYKKRPKDLLSTTQLAPPTYLGGYRCELCGERFSVSSIGSPPVNYTKCIHTRCSSPPLIILLIRWFKRQKLTGGGRLEEVEVETWEPLD